MCAQWLSRVRLFATLQTVASWDFLFMGLFKQEYQNGLPFPPPKDLPNPGNEPASSALHSLPLGHQGSPLKLRDMFKLNLEPFSYCLYFEYLKDILFYCSITNKKYCTTWLDNLRWKIEHGMHV